MNYFILWGPNATLLQHGQNNPSPTGRDAMRFNSATDAFEYIKHSDRFKESERSLLTVLRPVNEDEI